MPKGVIIIVFVPDPLGYLSLEPINTSFFLLDIISEVYIASDVLYFQADQGRTVKLAWENALNPTYNQKSPCESANTMSTQEAWREQQQLCCSICINTGGVQVQPSCWSPFVGQAQH